MAMSRAAIRMDDPLSWLHGLTLAQSSLELVVMAGCVAAAWLLTWTVRRATPQLELTILLGL